MDSSWFLKPSAIVEGFFYRKNKHLFSSIFVGLLYVLAFFSGCGIIPIMRKLVKRLEIRSKTPKRARKFVVTFLIGVFLIPTTFVLAELPNNSQPYPADLYAQCFDGIDNDGDGTVDLRDIDCPKCFDSLDNEPDGYIDMADPDCPKEGGSVLGAITGTVDDSDSVATTRTAHMRTASTRTATTRTASVRNAGSCRHIIVFRKIVPDPVQGFRFEYEFFCDNSVRMGTAKVENAAGMRTASVSSSSKMRTASVIRRATTTTATTRIADTRNTTNKMRVVSTRTAETSTVDNAGNTVPTETSLTKTAPVGESSMVFRTATTRIAQVRKPTVE
jgi:hypothetical protein